MRFSSQRPPPPSIPSPFTPNGFHQAVALRRRPEGVKTDKVRPLLVMFCNILLLCSGCDGATVGAGFRVTDSSLTDSTEYLMSYVCTAERKTQAVKQSQKTQAH